MFFLLATLLSVGAAQSAVRTIAGKTIYQDAKAFWWTNGPMASDADGCATAYNAADNGIDYLVRVPSVSESNLTLAR